MEASQKKVRTIDPVVPKVEIGISCLSFFFFFFLLKIFLIFVNLDILRSPSYILLYPLKQVAVDPSAIVPSPHPKDKALV